MKILGNESRFYSPEELANARQNYENTYSQDPAFTRHQIYGEKFIRSLMKVEGSRGLALINVIDDDGQTGVALVPVNKHGQELPYPEPEEGEVTTMDDPEAPKCPKICP